MKILVPLDIAHSVQPTVDEMTRLVDLSQADVTLLYVREALPAYESVINAVAHFADDFASKVTQKANTVFEGVKAQIVSRCKSVHSEIVSGPPAMMIETVGRNEKCDLTVLTPGQHSIVEKFFLGSVCSKVVKHGPGTILTCRPQKGKTAPAKNIIIGIDGSANSKSAIEKTAKLFGLSKAGVKVTLMHVVDMVDAIKLVSPVEFVSSVEQNLLMEGETFLADGKRILSGLGVNNVECLLKEGDPGSEIIHYAENNGTDLIVLGAQGRTAIQHFLLGSVSHRVATHAQCSVAVVKPEGLKA